MAHILEDPAIYNAFKQTKDLDKAIKRVGYVNLVPLLIPHYRKRIEELRVNKSPELEPLKFVTVPGHGEGAIIKPRENLQLKSGWQDKYDFIVLLNANDPDCDRLFMHQVRESDGVDEFKPCDLAQLRFSFLTSVVGGMSVCAGVQFQILIRACLHDPDDTLKKYREAADPTLKNPTWHTDQAAARAKAQADHAAAQAKKAAAAAAAAAKAAP